VRWELPGEILEEFCFGVRSPFFPWQASNLKGPRVAGWLVNGKWQMANEWSSTKARLPGALPRLREPKGAATR
jgi:hypothetical protein